MTGSPQFGRFWNPFISGTTTTHHSPRLWLESEKHTSPRLGKTGLTQLYQTEFLRFVSIYGIEHGKRIESYIDNKPVQFNFVFYLSQILTMMP